MTHIPDYSGTLPRSSKAEETAASNSGDPLWKTESYERQIRLLEGINSTTPDFIYAFDLNGQFLYANRRLLEVWGMTLTDVIGKTCRQLGYEQWHHDMHMAEIAQVIETKRPIKGEVPFEAPLTGIFGIYEYIFTPVLAADGEVEFIAGTTRDVTQRKQAEESVRHSEALYRAIGESIDYGVWICAPDGRNTYASASFLNLLGISQEQCSDWGWGDALHPDDAEQAIAAWTECARTGAMWDREHRFRGVDGQWHHILARGVPVKDEQGRILCWAGINLDITRLKCTEEQLRQSETRLEARVAERTSALLQSQEQLRALAADLNLTEQRERKRIAVELHDHLAQILVLGKLKLAQGTRSTASPAEVMKDVDAVLTDALAYTRTLIVELSPPVLYDQGLVPGLKWLADYMKKHDLAVAVTVTGADGIALPEDQLALLYQSVRELLINVVKHAETAKAAILVAQDPAFLRIEVRDEGKGFDSSTTGARRDHLKFGLLSIDERMKALGGSFGLKSQPGQGTTATLSLLLKETKARSVALPTTNKKKPASLLAETPTRSTSRPSSHLRVLLVDDHAMMREGLKSVLDSYADIQVVGVAGDGQEAIDMVTHLRPDVVVMDINMPQMNGIDATRAIKSRHPAIKVIGLSVNSGIENQEAMKEAGAVLLITKEAAVEQLYAAIRQTPSR